MLQQFKDIKNTIFAIDDSPVILEIVKNILGEQYIVSCFSSGEQALPAIKKENPDLILLDVVMPNLSGFEVIKILKEDDETSNIPVIFITSQRDLNFELEAFRLGAVDYIVKPFAAPLLLKRIELHLSLFIHHKVLTIYNENLKDIVNDKVKIIQELQSAIVYTLADLVERRDGATGGHVYRTQEYFRLILDFLRKHEIYRKELGRKDTRLLLEASQLHDIGKVAISDNILLKPGKLTEEEFEIMKTHTNIGESAILKAMEMTHDKIFLEFAAIVTISHHEKWDGTGYPKGLKGDAIPIEGRIMAIVDVYDALVSERPYKKSFSHTKAIQIIKEGKGKHFDPILTEAFLAIEAKFERVSQTDINEDLTEAII